MTKRIEQILKVVEVVTMEFDQTTSYQSLRDTRIRAVASVADQWGITTQSVLDTFIRRLRPHVKSASHFDNLLLAWLVNGSDELKNAILQHTQDEVDARAIDRAFFRG